MVHQSRPPVYALPELRVGRQISGWPVGRQQRGREGLQNPSWANQRQGTTSPLCIEQRENQKLRSGLVQNLEGSKKAPRCGKRLEVDIQKLQLMPKFNINNLTMTKVGPAV